MTIDRSRWKPLSPKLEAAIDEFKGWSNAALSALEVNDKIETPLYHYTNAAGLEGIVKS